jgi:hypothetical protein
MTAVLDQINQEVEYLRLDRDEVDTPAQFTSLDIENVIGKHKLHVTPRGA